MAKYDPLRSSWPAAAKTRLNCCSTTSPRWPLAGFRSPPATGGGPCRGRTPRTTSISRPQPGSRPASRSLPEEPTTPSAESSSSAAGRASPFQRPRIPAPVPEAGSRSLAKATPETGLIESGQAKARDAADGMEAQNRSGRPWLKRVVAYVRRGLTVLVLAAFTVGAIICGLLLLPDTSIPQPGSSSVEV